jgi:hypothetical protein
LNGTFTPTGTSYGDSIFWNGSAWAVSDTKLSIGQNAGKFDQGGGSIAIGTLAGNISQGDGCLAFGNEAGTSNQATGNGGFVSMAIGPGAGRENQGAYCIAIGPNAGRVGQQFGSTVFGAQAGYCNVDVGTIAIGQNAVFKGGAGSNGVAIGNAAAVEGIGDYSIAIGYYAGGNVEGSNVPANTIVFNATATNAPIASPGFYVNPVNGCNAGTYTLNYDTSTGEIFYSPPISDLRLKKNVSGTTLGLDFINRLRPVEFQWKDRKGCSLSSPDGDPDPAISPGVRVHQGLIAQEVKAVLNDLSVNSAIYMRIDDIPKKAMRVTPHDLSTNAVDECEIDLSNGMNGLHGVRYEELITPTIKAVQDVYAIVKQQSEQIAQLQFRIQTLENRLSTT